ncbi:MAG: flagellar basal body rod protein FlgB [bacterium]
MLGAFFKSIPYVAARKSLDTAALRQKVISHNLANVDTPHYKRSEVNFEDAFKRALERKPHRLVGFKTDHQHIPINPVPDPTKVEPSIWRQNDTFYRSDDNNVDIDVEMADLAKNELKFHSVVETLNRKMRRLTLSIRGRS